MLRALRARCFALQEASHQLVMITGDTPLTACHAAKQVHIVDRPVLILDHHRSTSFGQIPHGSCAYCWVSEGRRMEANARFLAVH